MDIKVLPYSLSKWGCKVTSDQNIKCFTRRLGEELLHEPVIPITVCFGEL